MYQNYTNGFTRESNLYELQLKERERLTSALVISGWVILFHGTGNRYLFGQTIL